MSSAIWMLIALNLLVLLLAYSYAEKFDELEREIERLRRLI